MKEFDIALQFSIFNFQFSTFNYELTLGVPATPSGFPLYLFPLRSKRMPLQSLTHLGYEKK